MATWRPQCFSWASGGHGTQVPKKAKGSVKSDGRAGSRSGSSHCLGITLRPPEETGSNTLTQGRVAEKERPGDFFN